MEDVFTIKKIANYIFELASCGRPELGWILIQQLLNQAKQNKCCLLKKNLRKNVLCRTSWINI